MVSVFWFFTGKFIEAFFIGILLRMFLGLITRSKVSLMGLFNTGWVFGLIYTVFTYYLVVTQPIR